MFLRRIVPGTTGTELYKKCQEHALTTKIIKPNTLATAKWHDYIMVR
jgi:hypothetical protein